MIQQKKMVKFDFLKLFIRYFGNYFSLENYNKKTAYKKIKFRLNIFEILKINAS